MANLSISVVESVLLFLNLQLSRSSPKQLRPNMVVTMDTSTPGSESEPSTHNRLQVLASGLGAYFLDGGTFIKQLCLYCPGLLAHSASSPTGPSGQHSVIEVLCRCTGEPSKVIRHVLVGLSVQEREPQIRESVVTRPGDLHPAALLVRLMIVSKEDLRVLGRNLTRQLHLLHLINPEVSLSLQVRDSCNRNIVEITFDATHFKSLRTPFKLVTSVSHYIDLRPVTSRLSQLRLFKGDTQTLQDCLHLQDGRRVCLKLYSAVAVLPHVKLKRDLKIPANRLCSKLHMFVYGPCSLPLVQPGSHPSFPLSLLADWECYGLSLNHTHTDHRGYPVVVPSFACDLANSRPQQPGRPSNPHPKHTLFMFLFLEDPTSSERTRLSDNVQWRYNMEVVHRLRLQLQGLIMSQSRKFQQATHSALNKIACNYGSHSKTKSTMGAALPLVGDAVASIVKHSTNELFRNTCMEALQVGSLKDIGANVEQRLWRMAKKTLGIPHPRDTGTKNPDEPTTPELALAVSTDSQTTPPPPVTTSHSEHALVDDCRQESPGHQTNLPNTQIQSLFSARVSSKRGPSQEDESRAEDSGVAQGHDYDDCFDSLCDIDDDGEFQIQTNRSPSPPDSGSQPLIGVAALLSVTGDGWEEGDCVGDDVSVSSFDELENCSENMEYDSQVEDMTGYDELEMYEDDSTCCVTNALTSSYELAMAGPSLRTNEEQVAEATAATLPRSEDQAYNTTLLVPDPSLSDEEWDCVLADDVTPLSVTQSIPHHVGSLNKGPVESTDFEQLAEYSVDDLLNTNTSDKRTILTTSDQAAVCSIDDEDFEWD